jgi:hypothetical protein
MTSTEHRGMPRWVKLFATLFVVLVVAIAVLHLTGNTFGNHGTHTPPAAGHR